MTTSVLPLHALHDAPANRDTSTPHGIATAHFGELRRPLLEFIIGSEILVGCVAWVTEKFVLEALAARPVALCVQKESWWKGSDVRGKAYATRYAALQGGLPASAFPEPLATKRVRGKQVPNDAVLAPIACVGYGGATQNSPLMHHKFIVRCTRDADGLLVPLAVWTGSFNFSLNANNSFENAIEIHDPTIAGAYLEEFALVASVSEPMNWRYSKPMPKGPGGTPFKPLPSPPKQTTTNVVKAGKRKPKKAAASIGKPAAKKAAPAKTAAAAKPATKRAAATPAKKTTAKKTTAAKPGAVKKTAAAKTAARKAPAKKRAVKPGSAKAALKRAVAKRDAGTPAGRRTR